MRVSEVFVAVSRNPGRHMVRRWNWKTALLSLGWRGTIFLTANLPAGVGAGLNALSVEICYRPLLSGFLSALTQALRFATPSWLSTLATIVLLPGLSHIIEFVVHGLCGTPRLGTSILLSLAFTVVSSMLELFAMRRGILVVGGTSRSLLQDLRSVPRLLLEFLTAYPQTVLRPMCPRGSAAMHSPLRTTANTLQARAFLSRTAG